MRAGGSDSASVPDFGWLASAHIDVGDLDGVVAVAEAVPGWDLGLRVAGCVGRAGAEAVAAAFGRLPREGPVLPLVRTLGRFDLSRVPVAFTGEADLDLRHRSGARPGLSAHGVDAGGDGRAASGIGDPGAYAHDGDTLRRTIGPLVHVVARLELADVRLGQDVDVLQPFHGGDAVPVGHDEPERRAMVRVE